MSTFRSSSCGPESLVPMRKVSLEEEAVYC